MRTDRTLHEWESLLKQALQTPRSDLCNFRVTAVHYLLSCALRDVLGPEAGANFHNWAVWGSRKAGVTIRQEDKDQASRDAAVVAGVVGALVGAGVGWLSVAIGVGSLLWSILLWSVMGLLVGS